MNYCLHVSPRLILPIVLLFTLKALAIEAAFLPERSWARTSNTCAFVSLAIPLLSPHGITPRPFSFISCMLFKCVPLNKCAGFTQRGLSHECITSNPSMSSDGFSITKEIRCAATGFLNPLTRKAPYSKGGYPRVAAFHHQHFSPFSTFDQNLSMSFSVKTIDGMPESSVDEASITCRIFRHSSNRVKRGMRFFFL